MNKGRLQAFSRASGFDINPLKAGQQQLDTLLFHGCKPDAATNIQADGLQLSFAANGMLGRGLYGAPDPRKSANPNYIGTSSLGRFMFLCRFNLSGRAQHAGPDTNHRNTLFHEFAVYDERHVVVLWMIKLV